MVKEADIIVIGKTVDATSRWETERSGQVFLYTYVTFEVERYIKGKSAGDVIVIKHAGGAVEIPIPDEPGVIELPSGFTREVTEEDIEYYKGLKEKFGDAYPAFIVGQLRSDSPTFVVGYRELLFLKRGGTFEGKPVFGVVGAFQGKYTIVEGKAVVDWGHGLTMEIFILSKRAELGDEGSKRELERRFYDYPKIPKDEVPSLEELLDRIEEIMSTGVIQTSWGKVKFFRRSLVRHGGKARGE
ncbi:MAG TPA: hypothetical protein EYP17_10565 [Candidatus Latescibacteria bacterium]|nr:hypothetical protein [Candidatus Latescibacterota bacterium]